MTADRATGPGRTGPIPLRLRGVSIRLGGPHSPPGRRRSRVTPALTPEALAALPPRLQDVLTAVFGVGRPPETLQAIGARLGLSRERVRQLKADALARLRGQPFRRYQPKPDTRKARLRRLLQTDPDRVTPEDRALLQRFLGLDGPRVPLAVLARERGVSLKTLNDRLTRLAQGSA